jgi:hypothetical protein
MTEMSASEMTLLYRHRWLDQCVKLRQSMRNNDGSTARSKIELKSVQRRLAQLRLAQKNEA